MSKQNSMNQSARQAALAALDGFEPAVTALIEYRSSGRVLVIANEEPGIFAISCLSENLSGQLLQLDQASDPDHITIPAAGRKIEISGHLGNFTIHLGTRGDAAFQTLSADLIVDLSDPPRLGMPIKPPGYIHAGTGLPEIELAMAPLEDMVGTFEKPRFFDYDPDICAHGRAGQPGCNRCVEACPTDAISALAESIEVNPYHCQGGGICAVVCPSGAIRYAYPDLETQLNRVRRMLRIYRENGGENPVVVFVADAETEALSLADNMLPVALEELASAGVETWLSCMAYGANQVILAGGSVPDSVKPWFDQQFVLAEQILQIAAIGDGRLQRIEDPAAAHEAITPPEHDRRATFGGMNDKRNMLFAAIGTLCNTDNSAHQLPAGSPLGRIHVDPESCTLCMACTSVCPAGAVTAGGDSPALLFFENNCVQCGICQNACPEDAITLEARLNLNTAQRRAAMVVNEQPPFLCVNCGKAFATRKVIDAMLEKLSDHPMFAGERARRRLMMCDDCRVVDVVQDDDMMNTLN